MNIESDTFSSTVDIEDNIQNIAETSAKPSIFNIKNILIVSSALTVILFGFLAFNQEALRKEFIPDLLKDKINIFKTVDPETNDSELIISLQSNWIYKVNPLTLEGKNFNSFTYSNPNSLITIRKMEVSKDKKRIYFQILNNSSDIFMLDVDAEVKKDLDDIKNLALPASSFCLSPNGLYFVEKNEKDFNLKFYDFKDQVTSQYSITTFSFEPSLCSLSKDRKALFYTYKQTNNVKVYMKTFNEPLDGFITDGTQYLDTSVETELFTISLINGFIQCPSNPNLMITIGTLNMKGNRNDIVIFDLINKTEFIRIPTNLKIEKVIKLEFSNDEKILYFIYSESSYGYRNIKLVKINYEKLMKIVKNRNILMDFMSEYKIKLKMDCFNVT